MAEYLYKIIQLTHDGRHDEQLTPLGAAGWLLVAVVGLQAYLVYDNTPPPPDPLRTNAKRKDRE